MRPNSARFKDGGVTNERVAPQKCLEKHQKAAGIKGIETIGIERQSQLMFRKRLLGPLILEKRVREMSPKKETAKWNST